MSYQKKEILIVDDNLTILATLKLILNRSGYDVVCCKSGKDVLARLSDNPTRLVISDLDMPVMDGRQLLTSIRKEYPETKVIIHTARDFELDEFLLLGAYDVLKKPSEVKTILLSVDQTLKDRRTTKRLEIQLPVYLAGSEGTTVNISGAGFLVASGDDFQALTGLQVAFSIPDFRPPLVAPVKILRSDPDLGQTAVTFTNQQGQALVQCLKNRI